MLFYVKKRGPNGKFKSSCGTVKVVNVTSNVSLRRFIWVFTSVTAFQSCYDIRFPVKEHSAKTHRLSITDEWFESG